MATETLINQQSADTAHAHHDSGSNKVFGFWVYIMSDCILFACLFATYAVLVNGVADGPTGKEIFQLPFVLTETALLLLSSITYGIAMLGMTKGDKSQVNLWLGLTFLLGFGFVAMELYEFHVMIEEGYGPSTSAFLSAYYALVGTHGLHVSIGLVWLLVLMYHVSRKGLTSLNRTRLMCLSMFWHFLDVIWICVFTVVYLMGAM